MRRKTVIGTEALLMEMERESCSRREQEISSLARVKFEMFIQHVCGEVKRQWMCV